MTSRDLLRLVLRRWYIVLLGAVLTVVVLEVVSHRPGVYFTQYEVVLLPPVNETTPNKIFDPGYGMTPMAGLLVSAYNNGVPQPLLGSAQTTLYGEGLARGSRVSLPNAGSQWQPLHTRPSIDVQVVGPTEDAVSAEAKRIHKDLERLLKRSQDDVGIGATMRLSLLASPSDPAVVYVAGSRARALFGVGVVGATTTVIAACWFDPRWARRRAPRTKGESRAAGDPASVSI